MKKTFLILVLLFALLCTSVSAFGDYPLPEGGTISGIAADGDDLLLADPSQKVVWRLNDDGAEVYAGNRRYRDLDDRVIPDYTDGSLAYARFMEPWAIVPFLEGWAVSDAAANVVRYISEDSVQTAAGSGKASLRNGFCLEAEFDRPTGLAVDDIGMLYIADTGNGLIRCQNTVGDVSTLIAGLDEPTGLCWADGVLYIAETGRSRILAYRSGQPEVLTGGAGGDDSGYADGAAASALFDHPQGIAVSKDGTVYIADTNNGAVRVLKDGRVNTLIASSDDLPQLSAPRGLLLQGDQLLVTDLLSGAVLLIDTEWPGFADVFESDWFYDPVCEAVSRHIIDGSAELFEPQRNMTRADFVDMLARLQCSLDGASVIDGDFSFTDIDNSVPYAATARWSGDFGIIIGTDTGAFEGEQAIERQQLVTILYRFVTLSGLDTAGSADLSAFSDGDTTAAYARDAMRWAVSRNIISGFPEGTLQPAGGATRAQAVKIIIYFMDMYGF